jgi:hypothetical protein
MGQLIFYDIEFLNRQGDTVLIRITDRELYDPTGDNTTETVSLIGYAPALELETFNVEEDKFNAIVGQRATIRFRSTDTVNFSTFARGEDYRFFVRITVNSTDIIFNGWLVMEDNQQPFLPAGQEVVLTATDNFGALKDVELSDSNGARPTGKYRLIEIISWCLRKTEGPYPGEGAAIYDGIKVADNMFEFNHHSTVDNCPLNQTYVDIRTFEKKPGELEDCNTVLTKILFSRGLRVCQYNNYWYILRIDEYKNSAFVIHNYGLGGNYISRTLGATLDKELDSNAITFIDAQTLQRIQRPYKSARCFANLEFPEEIPANVKFINGAVDDDVLPLKTFQIDNWTLGRGFGTHATTPNVDARIWRRYNSAGYENERYAVLTPQASSGGELNYIRSEAIEICEKDKFNFSFSYSADQDNSVNGPASISIAAIALHGIDSSVWILGDNSTAPGDEVPEWKLSDASHNTNADYYKWFFSSSSGSEDYRDWKDYSIEAPPAPVAGEVFIHFFAANQLGGTSIDDFAIRYNNVEFEYIPLVNGSYNTYTGIEFKMHTDDLYTKKLDEQFWLFDAPCKSYKGAMFYLDSGVYYNTSAWVDFAMEQYAIPDLLDFGYEHTHWMCNAMWNQARLETWILPSNLFGFDVANGYVSPIHKFSLPAQLAPVTNMNFIILGMRQNWHDCTWTATLATVNDTTNVRQGGNSAGENFEFKYLE